MRRAAVLVVALVLGCGPGAVGAGPNRTGLSLPHASAEGITLVSLERDGDPEGATALSVVTEGDRADESARMAAALGAMVDARLKKRGMADLVLAISGDGYRLRGSASTPAQTQLAMTAMMTALVEPATDDDLAAARDKLRALATRPLAGADEMPIARCTGEPRLSALGQELTRTTLEEWRARSHVRARIAFAVVGSNALTQAAATTLARAPRLPDGSFATNVLHEPTGTMTFEADTAASSASATITVARFFPGSAEAIDTAERLERSPLVGRLDALDVGAQVRRIGATAHPLGACVAVTVGLAEISREPEQTIAAATTIVEEELALILAPVPAEKPTDAKADDAPARRLADPRDAADAAAWLALSRRAAGPAFSFTRVALAPGRNAKIAVADVDAQITRARQAREKPTVDMRAKTERGQGELFIVLASPCGTMTESNADAGVGAAALSAMLPEAPPGVAIEPIVLPDALGFLIHGPALAAESPSAHARRLVDLVARPLLGEPISEDRARRALRSAFATAEDDTTRALASLAAETSPNHLSWLVPQGATDPLGRASERALIARVSALRAGPIRVAILANVDADQAKAAARAVDRWVSVRGTDARTCEPLAPPEIARPGTYAVTRTGPGPAEAFFATPIADPAAIHSARALVGVLDGPHGLLTKALENGLARSTSVRILGAPRAAALVVRVTTSDGALDAAVAQTRALFDRLAHGAINDAEMKRALDDRARLEADDARDPRKRTLALFHDPVPAPPETPDTIRALAAAMMRDDSWVIVALRPKKER